ncbi:MAG: FkbM family methyltransferase [Flavobacteriales bacterium]
MAGPLKGHRLLLDISRTAFEEMRLGTYDSFVWSTLPRLEKEGVVLDIGAHIGYTTLAFAAMYPERNVVAFEPNPVNRERFQVNVGLDSTLGQRIALQEEALGDRNGEVVFQASDQVDDETSSGGHIGGITPPLEAKVYTNAGFRSFTVPMRRLDDLVQERAWGPIALMKIDVEGAEHLVLAGSSSVLALHRPVLSIEVHSVACMLALDHILRPLDYEVRMVHEHRPSRAHIVAIPR